MGEAISRRFIATAATTTTTTATTSTPTTTAAAAAATTTTITRESGKCTAVQVQGWRKGQTVM